MSWEEWDETHRAKGSHTLAKDALRDIKEKAKRGNYSIYKIENKDGEKKYTNVKKNLTATEMRHHLKTNPAYKGQKDFGFGGRRTYPNK